MFCSNCGRKNGDGLKFCESCGCVLNQDNQSETESFQESYEDSPTVTSPSLTSVYNDYYNSQDNMKWEPTPSYINIPQPPEPPKKAKTGLIVGIVISVIIVLVAVFTALIISGTIDFDFSSKETTQEIKTKEDNEQTSKETTEKATEEETTEEETTESATSIAAKQNLIGTWNIVLSSSDVLYGNSNEMIMPVIVKFSSDGSYKMSLDETAYENMFENMIDALLEEEGYFEMSDTEKAEYLATVFEVDTEEQLYQMLYEAYTEENPINNWESELSSMPIPEKGFWAVNGDYLYLTDTESQRDAFLSNPSAYKHDVIRTSLTKGTFNFTVTEGNEDFIFVKQ